MAMVIHGTMVVLFPKALVVEVYEQGRNKMSCAPHGPRQGKHDSTGNEIVRWITRVISFYEGKSKKLTMKPTAITSIAILRLILHQKPKKKTKSMLRPQLPTARRTPGDAR